MPTPLLEALHSLWLALATALPLQPTPAEGWSDCNQNGVEDAVDIALGASSDADRNGIPDECEGAPAPRPVPAAVAATEVPRPDLQPFEARMVFPRVGRGCSERIEPPTGGARPSSTRLRSRGDA